jgi:predicted AAA+ superfamily ATPase
MNSMFNIDTIFNFNSIAKEQATKYPKKRFLYERIINLIKLDKDRIIGIIGQRGTGKTVILKQINKNIKSSLYISFDAFELKRVDINEIFETLIAISNQLKIKTFLFDEIHYLNDFPRLLKIIYDFTDFKILFTSSFSIKLSHLKRDLSRRVRMEHLHPFDFKEYLFFYYNINLEYIPFQNFIYDNHNIKMEYFGHEAKFKNYLKGLLFPFSLEVSNFLDNMKNIIEKIIYDDIPQIYNVSVKDLQDLKDTLKFIGKSEIDGINYSSISKNIGITKYKVKQFVEIFEKAFLLNVIYPIGTNVKKEPKIILTPPIRLLYRDYEDCIGGLREDFAVQMLKEKGFNLYYLKGPKGEKRPDYLIEIDDKKIVIEIGGKGKGF